MAGQSLRHSGRYGQWIAPCSRPRAWRRSRIGVLLVLVALVAVPASALAQQDALVPESVAPPSQTTPPPGFGISARQDQAAAASVEAVRQERAVLVSVALPDRPSRLRSGQERADHPGLKAMVAIPSTADEPGFEVMSSRPVSSRSTAATSAWTSS